MVAPKKKFGQHFLTDEHIAQKIVNSLNVPSTEHLIEVGPGTGMLTKYLRARKEQVVYHAEIDRESIAYLKETYEDIADFLIEGDFLRLDLQTIFKGDFAIIGNFPYNISSQIFFKALAHIDQVTQVVGMIQHEVAERIASPPGSKQYGILSVLLQAWFDIEYLFKVKPGVFFPPPKVDSAVIRLTRKEHYREVLACDPELFRRLVKTAFNQRRKMLRNSLKSLLGEQKLNDPIENKRPEQLSVSEFVYVTNLVSDIQKNM